MEDFLEKKKKIPQNLLWLIQLMAIVRKNKKYNGTISDYEKRLLNYTNNGNFRRYFRYLLLRRVFEKCGVKIYRNRKHTKYKINKDFLAEEIESYSAVVLILYYLFKFSSTIRVDSFSANAYLKNNKNKLKKLDIINKNL